MLFSRGHESWSETFFGSANDPPPSQPPRPHVSRAVDPTLGDAETYSSFPGAASPSQSGQDRRQELEKKDFMKDILWSTAQLLIMNVFIFSLSS